MDKYARVCERCYDEEKRFGRKIDEKICETCKARGLTLMPENYLAWNLYDLVRSQPIVYDGEKTAIIVLDVNVIAFYFDLYGVTGREEKKELLGKLNILHRISEGGIIQDDVHAS